MKSINELTPFLGKWNLEGDDIVGHQEMKWLDGNSFLFQLFDINYSGRNIKGIEIYEFDSKTQLCKKHLYDNEGHHFTYYYDLVEKEITIWFQAFGSDNYFKGKFTTDFQSYEGAWKWPDGGYSFIATKII
jgi:hypothetical protein